MKFYAIKGVNENKIFNTWEECQKYMAENKSLKCKSFLSLEEANAFLEDRVEVVNYDIPTAYIDGSYDAKTNSYSFGGVLLIGNKEYEFNKKYEADEFSCHRNIAGEIKGAGFIINYAYNHQIKELNIVYDYEGIEKWYTGAWKGKTRIALDYIDFAFRMKNKIKVNFIKVKSHSNDKYNDLADTLAKKALGI